MRATAVLSAHTPAGTKHLPISTAVPVAELSLTKQSGKLISNLNLWSAAFQVIGLLGIPETNCIGSFYSAHTARVVRNGVFFSGFQLVGF